ncbi:MAG: IclR family transcriptional regulator C-terminal domain-containing protein [Syntrophobacteraceae bacterium]|nr:IclR family transcriptional regulator C-terminal domain-containing protein [Syntrophobacteraceae bacterium]
MNSFNIENKPSPAPAVDRAFVILKFLAGAREPQGVSALARTLGIGKSSVHGILQGLLAAGAVEDAGGRKYRLGPLFEELARNRRDGRSLPEICRPYLAGLVQQMGYTGVFGVVDSDRFRIVSVVEGSGAFQVKAVQGGYIPLLAGATGKVVLAFGAAAMPDVLPRFTEDSMADAAALAEELSQVRARALALDRSEYLRGVYAAAAPILQGDRLLAILLSMGFQDQLGEEGLIALGRAVAQAARSASIELCEWRL